MSEDIFDRPGDWEIRTTIYRNGRKVATCDALGDSYQFAAYAVTTNLQLGDVDLHVRKERANG